MLNPAVADSDSNVSALRKQVQDLLKRIDKLEKKSERSEKSSSRNSPTVSSGQKNVSVRISGHVNRAVMAVHDGDRSRVKHVDNAHSSSRLRFDTKAKLNKDVKVGARWEIGIGANSGSKIAMGKEFDSTDSRIDTRHLFVYGDSKTYGRLSLGQTGEAGYGAMEKTDLSGTTLVTAGASFSDLTSDFRFFNTAQNRRDVNGGIRIDNVIDGFNRTRNSVIRYDTPVFYGLKASISHGSKSSDTTSVALRYRGEIYGTKVSSAIAFTNLKDHSVDTPQVSTENSAYKQYNVSIGLLHSSGLNFYLAGGRRDHSSKDIKRGSIWATKLGYQAGFFECGKTAFSVQYGEFNDLYPARNTPDDKFKAKAFGFGVVQNIDRIATELYFGVTRYLLDANTIDLNGVEVNA